MYEKINQWIVDHIYPLFGKAWTWLKKDGWQILNVVAVGVIYSTTKSDVAGIWLLLLCAMYMWKLFKFFSS